MIRHRQNGLGEETAATVRDVDASLIVRELLDTVPVEGRVQQPERSAVRPA